MQPRAVFGSGERVSQARSLLFVPGDRPDRIHTAFDSPADGVIVDLEDAVKSDNRPEARAIVAQIEEIAPAVGRLPLLVRVNEFGSSDFADDVQAAIAGGVTGIVVPKFVSGQRALELDEALSALEAESERTAPLLVVGLVESALGLLGLSGVAALPTRLVRLGFGAADYHADLGISYSPTGFHTDLAMATIVLASAAAGLAAPLDSPFFSLEDSTGLDAAIGRARAVGFGGKLCIHPKQLVAVRAGFSVSDAERRWATLVLAGWDDPSQGGAGAIRVDSELVDEAMVRRARQIMNSV